MKMMGSCMRTVRSALFGSSSRNLPQVVCLEEAHHAMVPLKSTSLVHCCLSDGVQQILYQLLVLRLAGMHRADRGRMEHMMSNTTCLTYTRSNVHTHTHTHAHTHARTHTHASTSVCFTDLQTHQAGDVSHAIKSGTASDRSSSLSDDAFISTRTSMARWR